MKIDVAENIADLEELRSAWLELWQRCPRATPFQAPQWVLPWVRHVFGGGRILGLAFRDAGDLVGLAPLFIWGTEQRTVSFLGAGISDYGDLVFAPGREDECASTLRSFLEQSADAWDALDLQEVRSGSALLSQWSAVECSVCPVLDLRAFPECMDHKHRTDVRRARNKLSREPGFELSIAEDLSEFFRLHATRWGDLGEPLRRFHCEVAAAFRASGHLRSFVLRTANGAAAAIYAFACGPTLYCYLSGFDPSMARLSPGAVLLAWAVDQAIADSLNEIDFLRQPEAYKYLWGARDRLNFALKSFPHAAIF